MDSVSTPGKIVVSTRATGTTESSMERVSIASQMELREEVNGKKESALPG